jgi:hypothetical protein
MRFLVHSVLSLTAQRNPQRSSRSGVFSRQRVKPMRGIAAGAHPNRGVYQEGKLMGLSSSKSDACRSFRGEAEGPRLARLGGAQPLR